MAAQQLTITGNLVGDPELKFTPNGAAVASLTVAVQDRYRDRSGEFKDGATTYFDVTAWRDLAEHCAASLSKGTRVVVTGSITSSSYEKEDGTKGYRWGVQADDVAASLRFAEATIRRAVRETARS